MPEGSEGNNGTERKPNWVEIRTLWINAGTLVVLTFTLIAVIVYACEAHKANKYSRQLAREASAANGQTIKRTEIATRPWIGVELSPEGFVTDPGVSFPVAIYDFSKVCSTDF
jgi:hypothetical protein